MTFATISTIGNHRGRCPGGSGFDRVSPRTEIERGCAERDGELLAIRRRHPRRVLKAVPLLSAARDFAHGLRFDRTSGANRRQHARRRGERDSGGEAMNGDVVQQGDAPVDSACGANLQTDGTNCGTCGHDWLGGKCSAGVCQPVVVTLQEHEPGPYAMVLDGTTLYSHQHARRHARVRFQSRQDRDQRHRNRSPSTTRPATRTPQSSTHSRSASPYKAAFSTRRSIRGRVSATIGRRGARCAVTGCTTKTLADYGIDSYAVVANASNVFFGSTDINDVYTLKAALDMTGQSTFATPQSEINGLAIDNTDVFFATVMRVSLRHHVRCELDHPRSIARRGAHDARCEQRLLHVHAVQRLSDDNLFRARWPAEIDQQQTHASPFGVATDATNIYSTDVGDDTSNSTTGAVYVCPVEGARTPKCSFRTARRRATIRVRS